MPYLVAADLPSEPAGKRFRALVGRGGILQLPGAHNGMAALQAKAAGFEALYLSGAAMSASMGLPDLGIITVEDVTFFVRQIVRASGLPVLVDGDTEEILGATIFGLQADDVVQIIGLAIQAGISYPTVRDALTIHPTVAEFLPSILGSLTPLY